MVDVLDEGVLLAFQEPVEVSLAYVIVSPLEITVKNIPVSPGPVVLEMMVLLVPKQERLDAVLKLPERRPFENIVPIWRSLEKLQTADTRKARVVATEVACVLLVAERMV